MTYQFPPLPTPAQQIRVDGWSPARQRLFLETLAATGIITAACNAAQISTRAAYTLRIRRDGAAFRLGWDAAILIARARLADDLLARALNGHEEVIRKDADGNEITRHRHDNRLAMSMLARLDRMADSPPEGSDAALARVVAQDFAAYLDLICPQDRAAADEADHPRPTPFPADPLGLDAEQADPALPMTPPGIGDAATALSPGASAALFLAARMALQQGGKGQDSPLQERCELRSPRVDLATLPPDEAVTRLRGVWWDNFGQGWRTDYPAPPGFEGEASEETYEIDYYQRDLTPQELEALEAMLAEDRRPYEEAAAIARDEFFGFPMAARAET
jgi:hypothetical protein